MPLPITAFYAGLAGLLLIVLSVRVMRLRRARRVGILDGGDPELGRAMRVQGNFTEYVPIVLILMALIEGNGGHAAVVHAIGVILVLARVLHAQGLSSSAGVSVGRTLGTAGTWFVVITASVMALVQAGQAL